MKLLTPLFAIAAPLVLWPVELFLPYPYIIEELVKGWLVWLNPKLSSAIVVGLAFAFSETVLYIFNLNPYRLLYTSLLHVTTTLVMYIFVRVNKKLIIVGMALASLIYFFYNSVLAGILL